MLGRDEPIGQLTLDGSLRPHSSSTQMSAPACTEQDGGRRTYSIPILYLGPVIKDGSQWSCHMPVLVTQRCFKRAKWRQIVDTATLAFSLLDRFWTPQSQIGIFIGQSAAALARIRKYQMQEPRNRCRPRQSAGNGQPSIEFFHSAELYCETDCSILLLETAPASVLRMPSEICSPVHSPVPDILAESRCRAPGRGLAAPNLLSPFSPHLDLPRESLPSRRIHVAHADLQCCGAHYSRNMQGCTAENEVHDCVLACHGETRPSVPRSPPWLPAAASESPCRRHTVHLDCMSVTTGGSSTSNCAVFCTTACSAQNSKIPVHIEGQGGQAAATSSSSRNVPPSRFGVCIKGGLERYCATHCSRLLRLPWALELHAGT